MSSCLSLLFHVSNSFSVGARIEEFLYEKLDRKAPSRVTNGELLGQYMTDAAKEFGPGTPYGRYASSCALFPSIISPLHTLQLCVESWDREEDGLVLL